ncbi:MAG: hypothetical protein ACP5O8_00945 [Candidatus Aenigmatarchaeota archaeon]
MRLKFWKKEEKVEAKPKEEVRITELEEFLADDKETYEMLFDTMFIDPRKIGTGMKEAYENAKKFEEAKDLTRAALWYKVAGGLAIYEGNVKKVREYFEKYEKLSGKTLLILKNPEKAVKKAQEYYQKYLK